MTVPVAGVELLQSGGGSGRRRNGAATCDAWESGGGRRLQWPGLRGCPLRCSVSEFFFFLKAGQLAIGVVRSAVF
jgi:hypothetical protein